MLVITCKGIRDQYTEKGPANCAVRKLDSTPIRVLAYDGFHGSIVLLYYDVRLLQHIACGKRAFAGPLLTMASTAALSRVVDATVRGHVGFDTSLGTRYVNCVPSRQVIAWRFHSLENGDDRPRSRTIPFQLGVEDAVGLRIAEESVRFRVCIYISQTFRFGSYSSIQMLWWFHEAATFQPF